MLSFGARVTSRIIEKPLLCLSETVFPKTGTVVKKMLNPNLSKGEQLVKRVIPGSNDITSFANVHHFDLISQKGNKILKAFDENENVLAEGINAVKQLMQKGKKAAEFWYRRH